MRGAQVVVQALVQRGFAVFAAEGPYEAIQILADCHVDVLFTDIVMPGMGDSFCAHRMNRQARIATGKIFNHRA